MFKILVADDEDIIRRGIVTILKRELENDICFLEAENGIEALKLCREHLPQMVITDIRMPFCDGLNFIKNVSESGHEPIFIILSGYADFEYAQNAIKLGVSEYILKPINKQELVTLVQGYVNKLKSEKKRLYDKIILDNEKKQVAEKVKQKLLKDLLDCTDTCNISTFQQELGNLGVVFSNNLLLCAVIKYQIFEENKEYIDFAVKNIADEVLSQETGYELVISVNYNSGTIAVIFQGLKRDIILQSAKQALSKICSLISRYFNVNVFCGIGEVVYGLMIINKSFLSACEALNYKIYEPGSYIKLYCDIPVSAKQNPKDFSKLISPLYSLNSAAIINIFEEMVHSEPSLQNLLLIQQSYSQLISAISNIQNKYNLIKKESIKDPPDFSELWSFTQLKQELLQYLKQVSKSAGDTRTDVTNKKLIVDVLEYVKENAAGDINLNIVADKFERTPAYMSALFKKDTGMGFNEYVTDIRMNMAKKMLTDTSIPVGEVSSLCGYPNAKYFSVVFKNTFGTSPVSYRQNSED
jgi:two-component system response regulator YesN